jgi:hypothetical protein
MNRLHFNQRVETSIPTPSVDSSVIGINEHGMVGQKRSDGIFHPMGALKKVVEINASNFFEFQEYNWGKIVIPEIEGKYYRIVGEPKIWRNEVVLTSNLNVSVDIVQIYHGYGPHSFMLGEWDGGSVGSLFREDQNYYVRTIPSGGRELLEGGAWYYRGGLTNATTPDEITLGDEGYPAAVIIWIGYIIGNGGEPQPINTPPFVIDPNFKMWIEVEYMIEG